MNLNFLSRIGGPTVQKAFLKASKYAPEILTGIGVTGVVASTILIARASTKLEPILDKHEVALAQNKSAAELVDSDGNKAFSDKEVKRDVVKVYAHTSIELIKLYGPAVSLSVGSLISILAAHGIMKRRLVVMTGAYKAVEGAFMAYRQRVIEEFGEEKDRDYQLGIRREKIEDETGKKKTVATFDPNHVSLYARWFDEGNPNWKPDPDYNMAFLKSQQNYLNDLLQIRGFVFLSEVYDALGFDPSPQAQVVGWVMDKKNGGDLHLDFNIFDASNRDFVNGEERNVLLDFNVDGVIIDLI